MRCRFGKPHLLLAFDLHDATIMHRDFDGPVTQAVECTDNAVDECLIKIGWHGHRSMCGGWTVAGAHTVRAAANDLERSFAALLIPEKMIDAAPLRVVQRASRHRIAHAARQFE